MQQKTKSVLIYGTILIITSASLILFWTLVIYKSASKEEGRPIFVDPLNTFAISIDGVVDKGHEIVALAPKFVNRSRFTNLVTNPVQILLGLSDDSLIVIKAYKEFPAKPGEVEVSSIVYWYDQEYDPLDLISTPYCTADVWNPNVSKYHIVFKQEARFLYYLKDDENDDQASKTELIFECVEKNETKARIKLNFLEFEIDRPPDTPRNKFAFPKHVTKILA